MIGNRDKTELKLKENKKYPVKSADVIYLVESFAKMERNMNNTKSCDYCLNYDYDEETGEMVCNVNICMDEDDYARIYAEGYKACPYFMINNEYKIVEHQN